jgi:ribonuclease G
MASALFVSRFGGHTWAALREDGHTVELRAERDGHPPHVGRIVKARVHKVVPGLQSAFLDVGLDRHAFLHVVDLVLPGEDASRPGALMAPASPDEEPVEEVEQRIPRGGPIEDRLKPGRELLVQIARESLGTKGPRVTCFISLPGRYLVHLPQASLRGVSRRIVDPAERVRLKASLDALDVPGGFILRTAGEGIEDSALRADAAWLAATWREIAARADQAVAPSVVHSDLGLLLRLLRDAPRDGLEAIVVEGAEARE